MTEAKTKPKRRAGLIWALIPVGAFAVQGVVLGVTMSLTSGTGLEAVEPNYYERSLDWDEHAELIRNADRLGWTLEITVGEPSGPLARRAVRARLTDASGVPIEDARIELEAFPHAAAGERVRAVLESGERARPTELTMRRAGLWEFRAHVTRGEDACALSSTIEVLE
ncbi:MAG: FixH family protein [Phycisphaerales bacterium]